MMPSTVFRLFLTKNFVFANVLQSELLQISTRSVWRNQPKQSAPKIEANVTNFVKNHLECYICSPTFWLQSACGPSKPEPSLYIYTVFKWTHGNDYVWWQSRLKLMAYILAPIIIIRKLYWLLLPVDLWSGWQCPAVSTKISAGIDGWNSTANASNVNSYCPINVLRHSDFGFDVLLYLNPDISGLSSIFVG